MINAISCNQRYNRLFTKLLAGIICILETAKSGPWLTFLMKMILSFQFLIRVLSFLAVLKKDADEEEDRHQNTNHHRQAGYH